MANLPRDKKLIDHILNNSRTLTPIPEASAWDRAKDAGIDLATGGIALADSAIGVTNVPTFGLAGKLIKSAGKNVVAALGEQIWGPLTPESKAEFMQEKSSDILARGYSPERQKEQAEVSRAFDESFVGGLGSVVENPSTAVGAFIQSAPSIVATGGGGKLLSGATKLSRPIASAISEGILAMGSAAEGIRGETEDGTITGKQLLLSGATGALTMGASALSGKIANKLGFADVDVWGSGKTSEATRKSYLKQALGGIVTEGFLEELPQSAQETILQNIALGKEWNEGVKEAAGMGLIVGAGMGGGVNLKQTLSNNLQVAKQQRLKELTGQAEVGQQAAVGETLAPASLDAGATPTMEQQQNAQQTQAQAQAAGEAMDEQIAAAKIQEAVSAPSSVTRAAAELGVEDHGVFMQAVYDIHGKVKTAAQFTSALVQQFGQNVKKYALQMWNQMKGILLNERGEWVLRKNNNEVQDLETADDPALAEALDTIQEGTAGEAQPIIRKGQGAQQQLKSLLEQIRTEDDEAKRLSLQEQYVSLTQDIDPNLDAFRSTAVSPNEVLSIEEQTIAQEAQKNAGDPVNQFSSKQVEEDNLLDRTQPVVNHSGGALGSDSYWGDAGVAYGINSKHYHAEGQKTPKGNTPIKKELLKKADVLIQKANLALKRRFPTSNDYVNNLLRRNAWQVYNSDGVFAVGEIEKGAKTVKGGTGWAVQMAIDSGRPVYVFDQQRDSWFKYDGKHFKSTGTPTLTNNFAGIGTRQLSAKGKKAIDEVYQKTFAAKKEATDLPTLDQALEDGYTAIMGKGDTVSSSPKLGKDEFDLIESVAPGTMSDAQQQKILQNNFIEGFNQETGSNYKLANPDIDHQMFDETDYDETYAEDGVERTGDGARKDSSGMRSVDADYDVKSGMFIDETSGRVNAIKTIRSAFDDQAFKKTLSRKLAANDTSPVDEANLDPLTREEKQQVRDTVQKSNEVSLRKIASALFKSRLEGKNKDARPVGKRIADIKAGNYATPAEMMVFELYALAEQHGASLKDVARFIAREERLVTSKMPSDDEAFKSLSKMTESKMNALETLFSHFENAYLSEVEDFSQESSAEQAAKVLQRGASTPAEQDLAANAPEVVKLLTRFKKDNPGQARVNKKALSILLTRPKRITDIIQNNRNASDEVIRQKIKEEIDAEITPKLLDAIIDEEVFYPLENKNVAVDEDYDPVSDPDYEERVLRPPEVKKVAGTGRKDKTESWTKEQILNRTKSGRDIAQKRAEGAEAERRQQAQNEASYRAFVEKRSAKDNDIRLGMENIPSILRVLNDLSFLGKNMSSRVLDVDEIAHRMSFVRNGATDEFRALPQAKQKALISETLIALYPVNTHYLTEDIRPYDIDNIDIRSEEPGVTEVDNVSARTGTRRNYAALVRVTYPTGRLWQDRGKQKILYSTTDPVTKKQLLRSELVAVDKAAERLAQLKADPFVINTKQNHPTMKKEYESFYTSPRLAEMENGEVAGLRKKHGPALQVLDVGKLDMIEGFDRQENSLEMLQAAGRAGAIEQVANQRGEDFKQYRRRLWKLHTNAFDKRIPAKDRKFIKDELNSELLKISTALSLAHYRQKNAVSAKTFEDLAEKYQGSGWTSADMYVAYVQNGSDLGRLVSTIARRIEAVERAAHQEKYRKALDGDVRGLVVHELSDHEKGLYQKIYPTNPKAADRRQAGENYARLDGMQKIRFRALRELEMLMSGRGTQAAIDEERSFATVKDEAGLKPASADLFERNDNPQGFEAELEVEAVGRIRNKVARGFYELVSKAFDADLVIVSDPYYRTRYIGEASDGRAKIVINTNKELSVHRVFSHELFHHVVNKAKPAEHKAFTAGIKELVSGSRWEDHIERIATEEGLSYERAEEELQAELFAKVMGQVPFYEHLAKDFAGTKIAGDLATRLLENIVKLDGISKMPMAFTNYENKSLIGSTDMLAAYELVSDMIGGREFVNQGRVGGALNSTERQHKDVRYQISLGLRSYNEVKQTLATPGKWLQGIWKKIFPKGTSNHRDVMSSIERILLSTLDWLKHQMPQGIFADFLGDPVAVKISNKAVFLGNLEATQAYYRVLQKHEAAFEEMSNTRLEEMHDLFVRGIEMTENKAVTARMEQAQKDLQNRKINQKTYTEAILKLAEQQYVKTPVEPIDVRSEAGRQRAKDYGYSDAVISAYADYQKLAASIYAELKKIDPELPQLATHYGQSLRWRKSGIALDEDISDVLLSETSRLQGSKHFTKEKAMDRTTAEIREQEGLAYDHINPNKVIEQYIKDAYKLIALTQMKDEAIEAGQAKIFTDHFEATKAGYEWVDDAAFEIKEGIKEKSQDKTGYAVNEVTEDGEFSEIEVYITREKAEEHMRRLEQQNPEAQYLVNPATAASEKQETIARVYFKKDLARMTRVVIAKDGFRNGKLLGVSGAQALKIKNHSTAIEFAMSLFHAFTIGQELTASTSSWTMQKKKGLAKLSGYNPVTALNDSRDIAALVKKLMENPELAGDEAFAAKADKLFGTSNADVLDIIRQFYLVGGDLHQDISLRSSTHALGKMKYSKGEAQFEMKDGELNISQPKANLSAMVGSVKDVHRTLINNNPDQPVAAMFKTMAFASLQGTTAWLMEETIPKVKLGVWIREYTQRLERQKDQIAAGQVSKEEIAHNTMKFVEDRFGEVNWTNQWMLPSYKSALQFLFRSFTWFTGSWKSLAKAGVDVGKLGWFAVKDLGAKDSEKVNYQLTEKGWWGVNAVIAHFMAAGMISLAYNIGVGLGGGGEVPDDEDVPLLTKMLFPRVDANDPQARISIPSYVTEAYKIFHHLGILGTHMEPTKMVSGRVNSIVGNAFEAFSGENFRGVTIRDSNDNVGKQAFDSLTHIFSIAPISMSSAYGDWRSKGFNPKLTTYSLLGLTSAPAVAKRSAAANKAFETRRKEFKGRATSEDEMTVRDKVKRAAYAYGQGDKAELNRMLRDGELSKRKYDNAIARLPRIGDKKNPRYKSPLVSAMTGLTLQGAIDTWQYATDSEKKVLRPLMFKKYSNMMSRRDKSSDEKQAFRIKMKELGILR